MKRNTQFVLFGSIGLVILLGLGGVVLIAMAVKELRDQERQSHLD